MSYGSATSNMQVGVQVKRRPDSSVDRYKARLVAHGFSQRYEIDFDETFSLIAKLTTVCVLIALVASKD